VIELEQQLANTVRIGRIVLDLSGATGAPPHTLSLLGGALRRLLHGGASLAIVGATTSVRSAIESCALEGVEFHRTVSTALSGWSPLRVRSTHLGGPDAPAQTFGRERHHTKMRTHAQTRLARRATARPMGGPSDLPAAARP
jgi:hypothetical protein